MSFYVRMALRSLRRTQGLNLVMIAALALGIGTWYAQRQIFTFLDSKIPDAPADLYLVALERGDPVPANRSRDIAPLYPSILLTPRDAQGVLAGGAPRRQTMTFGASALAEPDGAPAERVRVRYATRDFFALFRVPIVQGEPWPATADQGLLAGVATDAALVEEGFARRVFGEGPVVGRRMRIDGADVRIVGVVASYRDGRYHLYERFVPVPDAVYLPLASATAARAEPDFQHVVAGGETGSVYVWVELPTPAARAQLVADAEDHLARERAGGRAVAPRAVTLHAASRWRQLFIPRGTVRLWPLLSAMCLITCVVNLVRMLIVKFDGRGRDLGLLRALGARRRTVMAQLLLEAALIGFVAGVCGLLLGLAMMPIATGILTRDPTSASVISVGSALTTLGASVATALVAALYPAWRLARGTPAVQLRGR